MIDMKKTLFFTSILFGLMSASSCAMFEIDNYDAPSETLRGRVIDAATGEPVLTDQGSEGIRVRLEETSWEGNVTPQDFNCRPDGLSRTPNCSKRIIMSGLTGRSSLSYGFLLTVQSCRMILKMSISKE